jgi:hypothetical protein
MVQRSPAFPGFIPGFVGLNRSNYFVFNVLLENRGWGRGSDAGNQFEGRLECVISIPWLDLLVRFCAEEGLFSAKNINLVPATVVAWAKGRL